MLCTSHDMAAVHKQGARIELAHALLCRQALIVFQLGQHSRQNDDTVHHLYAIIQGDVIQEQLQQSY